MPIDCGADPDFTEMVRSFFGRELGQRDHSAEQDGFDADAWAQLEEMGFGLLTAAEDRGGSGATLAEGAVLLHAVAEHGIAVPYAEHDLLAAWLTERADLPPITGPTSLAVVDESPAAGEVFTAPCAEGTERILVVRLDEAGGAVQDMASGSFQFVSSATSGAEPRSEVRTTADVASTGIDADLARELWLRGALARSVQIVGALDRCVAEAVGHAAVRVQFGRPLTRFQAVQALLADAAAEAALASAATASAIVAWLEDEGPSERVEREVAVAKSCSSHAVERVTRNAHQVLGAMGTTLEHDLHRFTLPPLLWREDFGSARSWDVRIAAEAVSGGGVLWPRLAPVE